MVKYHLKRIALPRTWNFPRKSLNRDSKVFVSKSTGKSMIHSVPINTFIKEIVFLAETKKEVKFMLKNKTVLVNGTKVKDEKFPVGLFDIVSFEEMKKYYRLTLSVHGKLAAVEIDAKEKDTLIRRVESKQIIKGGKLQLNLFGSANLNVEKNDVAVGDVLVMKDGKVESVMTLSEGHQVILINGQHCGKIGVVKK